MVQLHPPNTGGLFGCCLLARAPVEVALGNPTRAASVLCSQNTQKLMWASCHIIATLTEKTALSEWPQFHLQGQHLGSAGHRSSATDRTVRERRNIRHHHASGYWELEGAWSHLRGQWLWWPLCICTDLAWCVHFVILIYRHHNGLSIRCIHHEELCMYKFTWKKQACRGMRWVADLAQKLCVASMCLCVSVYVINRCCAIIIVR